MLISTVLSLGGPHVAPALAHGLMSSPQVPPLHIARCALLLSLAAPPQRFNVAISRAKLLLVIIGDPNALFEDISWRQLLQYAVDNHAYRGCPHPLMIEGAPDEDDGEHCIAWRLDVWLIEMLRDWCTAGVATATRRMMELAQQSFGAGKLVTQPSSLDDCYHYKLLLSDADLVISQLIVSCRSTFANVPLTKWRSK